MSNRFVDSGWIYENGIEDCWLEADLPYGLAADGVLEVRCRNCDLLIVLNIWDSNDKILIVDDGGDERCGKEDDEDE
tara:strand:- start:694 stop:924 length:231 start_codon:yes stop_codon:yes gene_type:complete